MSARKLTPAQLRMLTDIRDHGNSTWSLRGLAEHGGANGTRQALIRRELAEWSNGGMIITEAGRAAIISSELCRCGHQDSTHANHLRSCNAPTCYCSTYRRYVTGPL